jgi:DNA primase
LVTGDTIIVTEGPFDAWRFGPPAVCTFGANMTETQIELLLEYKNISILFDFGSTGVRNAIEVANTLLSIDSTLNVSSYQTNAWEDPASIPPERISEVRAFLNMKSNKNN